ncbi:MAG: tripartite tricarboxylate transporter TctB family protein [Ferrovibrio sp.]
MRIHDALSGVVLALLAIAVLITVSFYPTIPGQNIGPAAFPGLVAVLLLVCALVLIWRGLRGERMALFTAGAWMRSPLHVVNFLLVVGGLLFYIFCSDFLGFIITGTLILGVLFYALHVRIMLILPIALGATLLIHTIFYKLLRVPLPWGLLQGLHW